MKNKVSLKWKIGRTLLLFGGLVIALLFLFQLVLLEPMYESSKVKSVKDISESIAERIEDGDLTADYLYQAQMQSDACIRVMQPDSYLITESDVRGCPMLRPVEINEFIANAASDDDGEYLTRTNTDLMPAGGQGFRNIFFTKLVYDDDDDDDVIAVIIVSAGIAAVNAATTALSRQLLYIGAAIVVLTLLLTLMLNRQIAKPLSVINETAKHLPEGSYAIDPKTNSYREAQELNETLEQAAKDIQKAEKAKRDLIANVSHDLRTPLTMISGYGEMMIDLPEEKTDENIQVIVDESKRLTSLVNDLLDLSRFQENRIELKKEIFSISDLVTSQMRKYDVYRVQEGYTIEEEIEPGLFVEADVKRMEQVFNNFMTNAINYSGREKKITVRVKADGTDARVEVQDLGEGIAKEDLANIWDRYYKVDKEHVRVAQGSGIGLAIVKEILELHRSKYGVESEKGKGSTFWFTLPLKEQA